MEEANSSQVAMLLPCRISWAYILILRNLAMFTVVPVGLLLSTAQGSDYPAVPVSTVLQLVM